MTGPTEQAPTPPGPALPAHPPESVTGMDVGDAGATGVAVGAAGDVAAVGGTDDGVTGEDVTGVGLTDVGVTELDVAGVGDVGAVGEDDGLAWLLFRLAGRVPDDGLAVLRTCIADGDIGEAAGLLVVALRTGRLPLTAEESDVAAQLLEESGADPSYVDIADQIAELAPPPYRFDAPADGEPAADLVAAVVAAGAKAGGLRGVWRVNRTSAYATVPVWLAETERNADVLELTAEMQHTLAENGEVPPRVEVFAEDTELTPYHDGALSGAALVWTALELPEPRLARAFDGADPERGPYFDPDHPRVTGAERDRLLGYLNGADVLLAGFEVLDDIVDPDAVGVVPVSFRCDGQWIWTDSVGYYLERHGLAPDPELRAHVLAAAGPPPRLSRLAAHRAIAVLTAPEPDGGEVAWQPG